MNKLLIYSLLLLLQVNKIMAEVDIDFNGKLDIYEFINLMKNIFLGSLNNLEDLDIAFKVFDGTGDGISRDEIRFILHNIGKVFKDDEFETVLDYYEDSKQKFSYQQFVNIFSQFLLL